MGNQHQHLLVYPHVAVARGGNEHGLSFVHPQVLLGTTIMAASLEDHPDLHLLVGQVGCVSLGPVSLLDPELWTR